MKEVKRRVLEVSKHLIYNDETYHKWLDDSQRRLIDISIRSLLGLNNKIVHGVVRERTDGDSLRS
jgi:hypothetical protein